ncbi:MAG: hypothetical protein JRI74_09205 [Deltaproteobacteria bacterium]|nr:hypothetical protein [Deltaproteobacteria bacterium]
MKDLKMEDPPLTEISNVRSIQNRETLSPLGRIMLENIALKPFLGVVMRLKELGVNVSQGYKIIDELTSLRVITPLTIDGNRFYELTAGGKKALGKKVTLKGRGGLEHRYCVEKIKEHYLRNEGFTFIEKDDIDLVIETVEKKMAVQVETGKSDIQGNLTKLGRYKADHKYVVTTNRETEIKTKELLQDLLIPDKENIHIIFAKDFLTNPPKL